MLLLCFSIALTLAFSSSVYAQQSLRVARVGILRVDAPSSPVAKEAIHDLKKGLTGLGYIEGHNIDFEIRWAENKLDRLSFVSAELVNLHPDVIVTGGPQAVKSLKAATNTIPIVMGRMGMSWSMDWFQASRIPEGTSPGPLFRRGSLAASGWSF